LMKHARALAVGVAALLAIAAPAPAASDGDRVAGFGTIEAAQFLNGDFQVAAHSGPLGEDPSGHVTVRASDGDSMTFHGDVSQACLIVVGNRAVAVGRLPEDEQFSTPGFGTVEFVAVLVEDNGHPVAGHAVDRAFAVLLRASTEALLCASRLVPASFATVPIEHGNYVVEDALP
jgi:hypothetical protein